jgi:hypothetical protein
MLLLVAEAMTLRQHPLVSRVSDAAEGHRAGTLTSEDLQRTFSAVMSAAGSDIPKSVRDALFQAEARIDSARFTVDRAGEPVAIKQILEDFDSTLQAADAALARRGMLPRAARYARSKPFSGRTMSNWPPPRAGDTTRVASPD